MNREEEDERKEEQFGVTIRHAFQMVLSEEEYSMSHTTAQNLYNKICAILLLIPTAIRKGLSKYR